MTPLRLMQDGGMPRRVLTVLAAVMTGAFVAGCGNGSSTTSGLASVKPAQLHGALPGTVAYVPAVELTDTSGVKHNLAVDAKSKILLLYFGYTHCKTECPTTMADVAAAYRQLPSWATQRLEVAFVTTDPRRDSPSVLKTWLSRFDPAFVGLRGSEHQVKLAETKVGIPLAQEEPAKPKDRVGKYAVNHFSAVLAYNQRGRLVALYPTGVTPATYIEDIKTIVADKVRAA
jgi:protein SCO1